ncbi:MAG: phage protease [Pseudolabrys sp.]
MSPRNASTSTVALQAVDLPSIAERQQIPDWIMLLPVGADGMVRTVDGRGPYRVGDLAQLAAHSITAGGGALPIDENHATDLAAPRGEPAPARGWVDKLDVRRDGIWGHVAWTSTGRDLLIDRAYRGISPVIVHDAKTNDVQRIARASLTNVPNLRGMSTLHAEENTMDELLKKLRAALGLADDADEGAVMTAIDKLKTDNATALQSQLQPIAKAAGLAETAAHALVLSTVTSLAAGAKKPGDDVVTALQSELKTVTEQLNTLQGQNAKDRATSFVDAAIKAGRVGVKPMRDHYISMHAADPARVEKEINAMPILDGGRVMDLTPPKTDGEVSLNAEQLNAAKLLGHDPKAYAATLKAEQPAG